ncbi:carboxy terminal-processing peptidase [Psychromonas sp. CD1]|uniref:carboxy terminal-processing peptidase n=1 Tax=Psychromonas sp. CD1 TaxID=1979839 RepID=UPI000B9B6045|nr:carboxy terminal-processing peptidase [Psychromonas sp. CD1]
MKHFFRHSLFLISSLYIGSAFSISANITLKDIPQLKQQAQHGKVAKRVSDLYSRSHYKYILLDDALSAQIFNRYIEVLDYNRQIFMQSDIDTLKQYQYRLDDDLKKGQLTDIYQIFQLNLQRRYERFSYALTLLDKEIKFKVSDSYEFDRTELPWAKNQAALDKLWQEKVKYEALSLKLNGKTWKDIKKLLTKRYQVAMTHLTQTESEDVFQSFMNAYSHAIDPHTSYLSPRNAKRFEMEMNLSLEGIGAVLQLQDDYTIIRSLVPGGPAEQSNEIFKDDKIISVGQKDEAMVDVIGWRLDDIVDLIKGPKGTKVFLEIMAKKSGNKNRIIELTREKIHLEEREAKSSVEVIDGKNIGVISIPSFYMNLSVDVDKELTKLQTKNISGIVIDLRNNGGGALSEATLLTGLFITTGPVVQVRDSRNEIFVHQDKNPKISYSGPLTVLINRYSASASEIFAAALQDYNRAIIIGEPSFGKGTVQQNRRIARFYDQDAETIGSVQYTIAKFYRITGGSTQNKGVTPDILFPSAVDPDETGESLEKNALPWDKVRKTNYTQWVSLDTKIAQLKIKNKARIKKEIEFSYLAEDIAQYQREKDTKTISLVEKVRITKQEKNEQEGLKRINERLKRAGLKEVKSIDDIPKDFEISDIFLIEAGHITLDFSKL